MKWLIKLRDWLIDNTNLHPENNVVEPPRIATVIEPPKEPEPLLEAEGVKVGDKFCFVRWNHMTFPLKYDQGELKWSHGTVFTVRSIEPRPPLNGWCHSFEHTDYSQFNFVCDDGFLFTFQDIKMKNVCREEEMDQYKKIIDAENDFKVEFKVRKKEGLEDFSVWWRSTNHPEYREWTCIANPNRDGNAMDSILSWYSYCEQSVCGTTYYYHPYYFDSKEDALEAVEILKTRDPKRLWTFERRWQDV